ncbi:NADP-dependent oxidoreductase [Nocardiopsis alba]|nr:NADP-dependent oxidoreductase [Nocardiopsis alba]
MSREGVVHMALAAFYTEYGDSDVLQVSELPVPEPGPGEVQVRVSYASVNPVDIKIRTGMLGDGGPLQGTTITGMDVAGTVERVGAGVTGFSPGDRVAGLSPSGAAAELVNTYAATLVHVPGSVDLRVASTIGVGGSTAVRALGLTGVSRGDTILVDGASGGVGTFLTQLAIARGATVVGTASQANHAHLRELGVVPIEYGEGWQARARAATDRPFDAAFDLVTGGKFRDFRALSSETAPIATLVDPEVPEQGGILVTGMEPGFEHALQEVMDAIADGGLRVPIAREFPLSEIAAAQDLVADGHTRGKVIVSVA